MHLTVAERPDFEKQIDRRQVDDHVGPLFKDR
jgi:hypothetical protein